MYGRMLAGADVNELFVGVLPSLQGQYDSRGLSIKWLSLIRLECEK